MPARGINADMLFAEKISDPDERFRRLENAVIDIRREFDAVSPAIVRLAAVESDMQELLGQLQTLVEGGPAPQNDLTLDSAPIEGVTADALPPRPFPNGPPEVAENIQPQPALPGLAPADSAPPAAAPLAAVTPAPAPPPAATAAPEPLAQAPPPVAERPPDTPPQARQPEAPPPAPALQPAPTTVGLAVVGIRTGEHEGVQRLVLDLNGPSTHHSDLDNGEKLILIEMPQAGWSAAPNGTFADAPLLASWTTEPLADGKGTRLILQLRHAVEIVSDISLTGPHRIVLDLKKSP